MLSAFKDHINTSLSFLKEGKLLIANSGGIDSMVLTHLCQYSNLNFGLAHCNFNLRGNESDHDEDFVIDYADTNDIEVFVQKFDTEVYAKSERISIQMAARELRYKWFNELANTLQFDYVLTAHHVDDNLETFLINLSRGTGLEGLTGIPEINNNIVRPLLPFSRKDIHSYANDNNLKWREDKSNLDTKYLRNNIRHNIVPELIKTNPEFLNNFNQTIGYLRQANSVIEAYVENCSDEIVNVEKSGIMLNIEMIKALDHPETFLYSFLKPYGFTEHNDIYNLLDAQSGKSVYSNKWHLLKDRTYLILTENNKLEFKPLIINNLESSIVTSIGTLEFQMASEIEKLESNIAYIDLDKLHFPLELRTWKEGDLFYPAGLNGKKKLSKYFKDEKLSLLEKESTLILCSKERIVWVAGRRLDERFKATKNTRKILKIVFSNADN